MPLASIRSRKYSYTITCVPSYRPSLHTTQKHTPLEVILETSKQRTIEPSANCLALSTNRAREEQNLLHNPKYMRCLSPNRLTLTWPEGHSLLRGGWPGEYEYGIREDSYKFSIQHLAHHKQMRDSIIAEQARCPRAFFLSFLFFSLLSFFSFFFFSLFLPAPNPSIRLEF